MEKMVFKNDLLNIIFGALLIIFAIVGYFTNIIEDYLPIIIGIVLVLLSAKRFLFSFKKITSKNATLILVIEFFLDLVFAGLMIYLQDHVELLLGAIIYIRGVSYLIINYVATRKVKLGQYVLNIGYLTFGAFLMFTSYNSVSFLAIFISALMLLFGAIYLQAGVTKVVEKEELEEQQEKKEKEQQKLQKIEAKSEKKIEELETKVKEVEKEQKKVITEKNDLEKKVEKLIPKKEKEVDYDSLTLVELKEMAKKKDLKGYSQLKKSELIDKLKE